MEGFLRCRGTKPDTVSRVLGDVLPVQEADQIAQPRESDQAFVTQGGPRDFAGDENR